MKSRDELGGVLAHADPIKLIGGVVMAVVLVTSILSGAFDGGTPLQPWLIGAFGLGALGCFGVAMEELAAARAKRHALLKADAEELDSLRRAIAEEAISKPGTTDAAGPDEGGHRMRVAERGEIPTDGETR